MSELPWRGPLGNGALPAQVRRYCEVYQADLEDGHLTVIVGKEPDGWHLSISHRLGITDPTGRQIPGRIPSYEELKEARYRFCPADIWMVQVFPPPSEFLNHHPTTLHLWEMPAEQMKGFRDDSDLFNRGLYSP